MDINYQKRIFGLDLMRALAIMLVVFSHIKWILPETSQLLSNIMGLSGFIGVEIFFVLSGFLIGRLMYHSFVLEDINRASLCYFWIRRWFRTLPNYYLVLLLNIAIALFLGFELPNNVWKYGFFLQNFAWELPFFFNESWTLSVEEFAYILGPGILYVIVGSFKGVSKSSFFLIATIGIILFFSLTKLWFYMKGPTVDMVSWNLNLKAVVVYRIDAIYYGVLAAFISMVNPNFWNKYKNVLFGVGVSIFLGLNVILSWKQIFIEVYPLFWNVFYLPINSIAIMLTLPLMSSIKTARNIFLKAITFISIISYSIYLLHYSVVMQLLKHFVSTEGLGRIELCLYCSGYLAITILVAYMVYRYYEKPMMDLRDKRTIIKLVR
ncbi:acyltransferase [Mangrovimonas sp. DI 80]|uniref:acyltransferase family protein n=1 Tax=Mangrovimonas sp. DI 80 TaxID=1779330 RepID=UPI0009786DE7|nr:acyltransferase [Mangrovimonas sp. DI 80]OMP31300.1 hypothetical protein BKM32_09640 [Mangrovimonas sp. DI 80]